MNEIMKNLREIYDWLEDTESKDIFLNRINYLISHDYKYIDNIIEKYLPDMARKCDKKTADLATSLPENVPFVLYGAGERAREVIKYFDKHENFVGLCDKDKEKQKQIICGHKVYSLEYVVDNPEILIIITPVKMRSEIKKELICLGVSEDRIFLVEPYVFPIQDEQYFNCNFMHYEDEVFVDAGAYVMDTSLKLQSKCKRIKKIYAFEPDSENFRRCMEAKKFFKNVDIKLYQKGCWSKTDRLFFEQKTDSHSASMISDNGNMFVDVMAIDDVVDNEDIVTFIKMDIEGAELEALKGAKNTILRCKPKLAICIYHKPEDVYEIPIFIKRLVPEYKLYVRHHSSWAAETVLYAIV